MAGDCNDGHPHAYPFALELCNGVDDDCDARVDEPDARGCRAFYADRDGDGVGDGADVACMCTAEGAFTAGRGGDCDDADPAKSPVQLEDCDGVDNDCDGAIDERLTMSGYADSDGDGWGAGPPREGCGTETLVSRSGDCNDGSSVVHPSASEACNLLDDDCDGTVDEGFDGECMATDTDGDGLLDGVDNCALTPNAAQDDLDADGVGDLCDSDQDGDGSEDTADCDPRNPAVSPAASELCDSADNDCDATVDEGFAVGASCEAGVGACHQVGMTVCAPSGAGTTCSVAPGPPAVEACNGTDDDCDGMTDEGEICPDTTVRNTVPFTRGVWYTSSTSSCGATRLFQFWPVFDTTFSYSGFDCHSRWWMFRPSDHAVFYSATFSGIFEHSEVGAEVLVSTPPCEPNAPFGFDSMDRLYYGCGTSLRRASGELLSNDVSRLLLVMADGRTVVERGSVLAVLAADGTTVTTYDPAATYAGQLELLPLSGSVNGNDGFIVYSRELTGYPPEILVLRIDASSVVRQVRRIPMTTAVGRGTSLLAISDGSVFVMERDAATTFDYQIRRYAPDGTNAVVWREAETTYGVHIDRQMLPGPLR